MSDNLTRDRSSVGQSQQAEQVSAPPSQGVLPGALSSDELFTKPVASHEPRAEIVCSICGAMRANEDDYCPGCEASDLKAQQRRLEKRTAQPPVPVVHGVVYDRGGWICSICHGWNCLKEKHCQHVHSGSAATKESAR